MSVGFYRGSPGNLDSRTLSRKTLSRWTGRKSEMLRQALAMWGHRASRKARALSTTTIMITITLLITVIISITFSIVL